MELSSCLVASVARNMTPNTTSAGNNLNAEIVLGTVRCACPLLPNLTLVRSYIRILKSPALYSVGVDHQDKDGAAAKSSSVPAKAALTWWGLMTLLQFQGCSC